jgi:hypothetical protein
MWVFHQMLNRITTTIICKQQVHKYLTELPSCVGSIKSELDTSTRIIILQFFDSPTAPELKRFSFGRSCDSRFVLEQRTRSINCHDCFIHFVDISERIRLLCCGVCCLVCVACTYSGHLNLVNGSTLCSICRRLTCIACMTLHMQTMPLAIVLFFHCHTFC